MTVQNDFLPFAAASGANVIDQPTYSGLGARTNGMTAGVAPSAVFNKVMRQMSIMAAVLAQMIADQTGNPVIDDGTTATIEANLIAAIKILGGAPHYTNGPVTIGYGSYSVDTSDGAFTLTLPPTPAIGTIIEFEDIADVWSFNPLTISGNGNTIMGDTNPLVCNSSGLKLRIWFNGSDWRIT